MPLVQGVACSNVRTAISLARRKGLSVTSANSGLHQFQPTSAGRREMNVALSAARQPCLDLGHLVITVIAYAQMNVESAGKMRRCRWKTRELLMPVLPVSGADCYTDGHIQGCNSMAFVAMRLSGLYTEDQWQNWRGEVQRLNLARYIHTAPLRDAADLGITQHCVAPFR